MKRTASGPLIEVRAESRFLWKAPDNAVQAVLSDLTTYSARIPAALCPPAVSFSRETRKGYFMDEWVAAGGMRLIRLPYSLNGLVSRVATPLRPEEIELFGPLEDNRCIPSFLQSRDRRE